MTEADLKVYGWLKDKQHVGVMCWRDPLAKLSWYTLKDAVSIQERRIEAMEPMEPIVYVNVQETRP